MKIRIVIPSIPLMDQTPTVLDLLKQTDFKEFITTDAWEKHLDFLEIKTSRHRQIATEGALVGSILAKSFFVDLTIMSDDAGQFNIFQHILCWIHAERKINELVPLHDAHEKDIQHIRLVLEISGWQFITGCLILQRVIKATFR